MGIFLEVPLLLFKHEKPENDSSFLAMLCCLIILSWPFGEFPHLRSDKLGLKPELELLTCCYQGIRELYYVGIICCSIPYSQPVRLGLGLRI